MFIATVNTGRFEFQAIHGSEDDVHRSLLQAWRYHCRDYPDAQRTLMRDLLVDGEVTIVEIEVGTVLRDGSPLRPHDPNREA